MKLIAFILFLVAGIFITFPWVFHLTDYVTGYGDNFGLSWIHVWAIKSIVSGNILNLFNTNIFYPYQIGPSASDPNLASAIFSLIPYFLLKEPIVTVNFITILSIILVGYSLFLLSYYLTKDFLTSLFCGVLVIFSPAYLSFYAHLQMFFIFFVPLSLMYFLIFLKLGKRKFLIISLTLFLFQTYNNFIAGYFILFSYAIIFFFSLIANKKQTLGLVTKQHAIIFLAFLALIIPVIIPYFSVSKEFSYVRNIKDTVHFALQPEDFLYSSDFSRLNLYLNNLPINKTSQNSEFKPGYLGAIFTLLVIITFTYALKNLKKKNVHLNSFLAISILGIVLSLGPVLHLGRQTIHNPSLIPLPYALFYYLVPGFQGFRNSARWEMLFILGSAIVIAIILSKLLKKYSLNVRILIYSVLIIGVVIEFNFPMKFVKIPAVKDFPSEHKWLQTTPTNIKYIEMPIYNWDMYKYATIELWRMYFSTIHFRRTVNGGGGFTPPPWQKMVYELDETFPSEKSINKLDSLGLNYIIVHKNEFDTLNNDKFIINNTRIEDGQTVIKKLDNNSKLKLIKKFDDTYIYQIN